MNLLEKDIRVEFFKSSGPGGQHKNKRFTAVKVTHIPTGIFSVATEQRSQAQNKKAAIERLKRKIEVLTRKKKKRIPVKMPRSV
ncbi:MAG: peptide chain release factor-like protein, partial [Candidatus Omnitrophica bacterium]|nr:peptide chain release factor-like protein [Candidatus Omnitrophota bacterium]